MKKITLILILFVLFSILINSVNISSLAVKELKSEIKEKETTIQSNFKNTILLTLLIIFLIIIILIIKHMPKENNLENIEDIKAYIKKEMKKKAPSEITKSLMESGWGHMEVKQALNEILIEGR